LIEDGVTGLLRAPEPQVLADAVLELAAAPLRRQALAGAALRAVRGRTWERALSLLGDGYRLALAREALAARAGGDARAA
jgi:glycosyltransferase involved in cell wall biosynthesis